MVGAQMLSHHLHCRHQLRYAAVSSAGRTYGPTVTQQELFHAIQKIGSNTEVCDAAASTIRHMQAPGTQASQGHLGRAAWAR